MAPVVCGRCEHDLPDGRPVAFGSPHYEARCRQCGTLNQWHERMVDMEAQRGKARLAPAEKCPGRDLCGHWQENAIDAAITT